MVRDNKLVDLIAAVLTGIGLSWLDLSNYPTFLILLTFKDVLQSASIRIGAFVLVALLLFLWKHKLRTQWGWVAMAAFGMIIISIIDEMIYRATATAGELNFMPEFSPFPMEIVLYVMPALLFMGAAHYIGLLVVSRGRKYA